MTKPSKSIFKNKVKIAAAKNEQPNCNEPNTAFPVIGANLATSTNTSTEKIINNALAVMFKIMQPIKYANKPLELDATIKTPTLDDKG